HSIFCDGPHGPETVNGCPVLRRQEPPQLARVPLGGGSCLRRTGPPFTVSGPCGPSQKIECVFSASPETIRREPREFDLRRSVGNRRTWQSARCVILLFFRRGGPRFLGRYAPRICERYEIALPPIHGEQISHHLPSYGQRRSIGISFLLFSFIDQGQIMILSGCPLRGFHQHTLDTFVALFGKRGAHHLVGRALFITAEPAVTDGFSDRGETRNLSHFQCPGQRRDRSYSRNGPELLDSLGQQRIPLQRTDQGIVRCLHSHDAVSAHPQQRPDTLIHLFVACE